MMKRLPIALIVLATSVPAVVARRAEQAGGGANAPNPAANPPRLALDQRIAHGDPSAIGRPRPCTVGRAG